jgi:hypothetical protein
MTAMSQLYDRLIPVRFRMLDADRIGEWFAIQDRWMAWYERMKG